MNWLHFLSWVAGLYLLYYIALFLFDGSRSRTTKTPANGELTFSEDLPPKKIAHLPDRTENEPPKQVTKPEPAIIGSGGVSLKSLFGLCREEAIIYTRPVSF
jgi:hypothetical protein